MYYEVQNFAFQAMLNFRTIHRSYSSKAGLSASVFRKLKPRYLIPLAIGLGIGGCCLEEVRSDASKPNPEDQEKTYTGKTWRTRFYRLLPWRTVSRTWGAVCSLNGPKWTCNSMISWYAGFELSIII